MAPGILNNSTVDFTVTDPVYIEIGGSVLDVEMD